MSENAPIVGVMIGRETAILEADDAFLGIIGYTRDDLVRGRIDWAAMTPSEYLPLDEAGIQQAAVTGGFTVPYQKEFIRKDGARVPVLLVCAFISVEDMHWMGYVVDLSASTSPQATPPPKTPDTTEPQPQEFLARLVEELVRERTRTQLMLDSASALIWAVDDRYRLLSENRAFRGAVEFTAGRRLRVGESLVADDHPVEIRAFWKDHYDRALGGERHTARWVNELLDSTTFDYTFSAIDEGQGVVRGVTVEGVDVTAEVAAERALQANEARFRSIFEHAGDIAFMTDADFRVTFVTDSISEVFGHEPDDALGQSMWQVFDVTAVDLTAEVVASRLEQRGARVTAKARITDSAGRPRWIETTIVNLLDDPAVRGYVGNVRDATEEHAAGELLEYRRSLLRLAGRLAKVGGWAVDARTRRLTISDELYALLDIEPATIEAGVGLDTSVLFYLPAWREPLMAAFEACFADGAVFDMEVEAHTPLGRRLWLQVMGEPQRDGRGRIVAIQGAIADISERRLNESTLRQQATLLDRATDAIIERDLEGRVQYWNRAAELLYGWSADEAVGAQLVDLIYQGLPEQFREINTAIQRDGEWAGRRLHHRKNGTSLWVEIHLNLIGDSDGTPIGVMSIGHDVTERVELEEQLARVQRLESVGQLTGGIAHDFNNLLTVIIGGAELLTNELDDNSDLRSLASMVLAAAERGSQLTSRLLSFARRQPLQPRVVDPAAIVNGTCELLRRSLPETIDVVVNHDADLWVISVDPGLLEAALMNVAINARDAMPHGGSLRIHSSNTVIDAERLAGDSDTRPGDYVLVSIEDTGEGMPADVLARAFDPFFTTKDIGKGSGLGLSMVYGFIKQSGGHIEIHSDIGRGTTIELYLPRADQQVVVIEHPDTVAPLPMGTESVLVVEDNSLVLAHSSRLLQEFGYCVLEATDGPSALRVLQGDAHIDLLFTDVVMPNGMTGIELAAEALRLRPELRVLYTSGYTETAITQSGTNATTTRLLTKPYHRQELAIAIRSAIDGDPTDRVTAPE